MIDSPNANHSHRRQELQEKIIDIEQELRQLREQLHAEEEADQHAVIENLDAYLSEIDNKYDNLRTFWLSIREEFRALVHHEDRPAKEK